MRFACKSTTLISEYVMEKEILIPQSLLKNKITDIFVTLVVVLFHF